MSLFPIIQPVTVQAVTELPLYADVAWDFLRDEPMFDDNGEPVMLTGKTQLLYGRGTRSTPSAASTISGHGTTAVTCTN